MVQIVGIISTYVAIWLPALTAILGVVSTVIIALNKTRAAIAELKNTDTLKSLSTQVKQELQQNTQIRKQLDVIIDQLAKIENYRKEAHK